MNRAEFSWALSAVLPHASKRRGVGIEQRGERLYVYATDTYSLGVAWVEHPSPVVQAKHLIDSKEAGELERWVRPQRVSEREQWVNYLIDAETDELHLAIGGADDSAVFEAKPGSELDELLSLVLNADKRPTEFKPIAVNPAFLSRFGKASRDAGPVIVDWRAGGRSGGHFLVRANNFVGLGMNVAYEYTPEIGDLRELLAS